MEDKGMEAPKAPEKDLVPGLEVMKTNVKLETQMKDHGEKINKTEGLEKMDQTVDMKSIENTPKAEIEAENSLDKVADNPTEKVTVIPIEMEIPTETEEIKVHLETEETIPPKKEENILPETEEVIPLETEKTTPPETEETMQEIVTGRTVHTEEQHQMR